MDNFRGSYSRRVRGDSRRNFRVPADGAECRDWLKDELGELESGEIAQDADCTKRAAENIRAGENGIRMENLVAMCRNNPLFRASFFEFCGGELGVDPGISAAINDYVRRKAAMERAE